MIDRSKNVVGYKKPPLACQFKKGKSGNHKGRPRQSVYPKSMAQIFREVASEVVEIEADEPLLFQVNGKNDSLAAGWRNLARCGVSVLRDRNGERVRRD